MTTVEVVRRIHELPKATRAQREVIDFLEFAYGDIPFMSVDQVASGSGVSKATVVRLVQRLGYESFESLKREIRESLYPSAESPATRIGELRPSGDIASIVEGHRERQSKNFDETFDSLELAEVANLCATLVAAERVWVYGQRFSYGVAFALGLRLSQLLPTVFTISGEAGTAADAFSMASPSDHVLIVAHSRIGREKSDLVAFLRQKRVGYSFVTDSPDDPICSEARHVLRSSTEPVGAFNLYASSWMVAEVLASVLEAFAPSARQRITDSEVAFQHLHTFRR